MTFVWGLSQWLTQHGGFLSVACGGSALRGGTGQCGDIGRLVYKQDIDLTCTHDFPWSEQCFGCSSFKTCRTRKKLVDEGDQLPRSVQE